MLNAKLIVAQGGKSLKRQKNISFFNDGILSVSQAQITHYDHKKARKPAPFLGLYIVCHRRST